MHLKVQKRKGGEYLSIVQSYREGGTVRTRTVQTIGYAERYADRYDDPIAHFREYVERLNEEERKGKGPVAFHFQLDDAISERVAPTARLGAAVALGCLDAIGVGEFFQERAGRKGFPDHVGRVFEMLATERMMHVTSKRESWAARESFPRACAYDFEDVYGALPCFARESAHLEARFLRNWREISGDSPTEEIYVVCGTYAFPAEDGASSVGLLGSIAVALDAHAMPLGYETRRGHFPPEMMHEVTSVLKERLGASRAIVIAGSLRSNDSLIERLVGSGDGFVLLESGEGAGGERAAWATDERDYSSAGGMAMMKARTVKRGVQGGGEIPVKEVALRGGDYALRQGHAVIATSEVGLSAMAIVQLFRELWRQAEPFQPLEADFSPMPVHVSADEHIQAHFALCYASFLALRVLRWQMGWRHNAADAADALLRMEGVFLQQNYYLFSYRSEVTDDIETAVGLAQGKRLRTRQELASVPATVRRAIGSGR